MSLMFSCHLISVIDHSRWQSCEPDSILNFDYYVLARALLFPQPIHWTTGEHVPTFSRSHLKQLPGEEHGDNQLGICINSPLLSKMCFARCCLTCIVWQSLCRKMYVLHMRLKPRRLFSYSLYDGGMSLCNLLKSQIKTCTCKQEFVTVTHILVWCKSSCFFFTLYQTKWDFRQQEGVPQAKDAWMAWKSYCIMLYPLEGHPRGPFITFSCTLGHHTGCMDCCRKLRDSPELQAVVLSAEFVLRARLLTKTAKIRNKWRDKWMAGKMNLYATKNNKTHNTHRSFSLVVCWFVSNITQKLLNGFPPNLAGGCVPAQNRPH